MIPVTRSNHFLLPEMMDLCLRLGLTHVELVPALPPVEQKETPQRWLGRYSVMAGDVAAALQKAKAIGLLASVHAWPLCMAGSMTPESGSLDTMTLDIPPQVAWEGPLPVLAAQQYPEACSNCVRQASCSGLSAAYIEMYGAEEVAPFRS